MNDYYQLLVHDHEILAELPSDLEKKMEEITNQIISDIYAGKDTLNQQYIDTINNLLFGIVQNQFDTSNPDFDSKDEEFIKVVKENVYQFVNGKNAALNKTLQDLLLDDDNNVRPFTQFKQEAEKAGLLFNKTYLKTEYQTAILQSQNAVDWRAFEDHDLLRFDAVLDGHTEKLDRSLDGVVLPKSDSFWNYASPQLHYNCRCRLLVVNDVEVTKLSKSKKATIKKQIPTGFRDNVGITGNIFPKDHPYLKK